jgi:hypothetical protein
MLNTPSGSRISLASLALMTLALSACQTTPAPTHAVKVTVTRGFNDYAPVPGKVTRTSSTQYSPLQPEAPQADVIQPGIFQPTTGVIGERQNTQAAVNAASAINTARTALSGIPGGAIESLNVQQNFDYSSTQDVAVKLSVFNPNLKAYSGVPIAVFDGANQEPLLQGLTNANGIFEQMLRVPAHVKSVNVQVSAIGIDNSATLPIQAGKVTATFGNAPTN